MEKLTLALDWTPNINHIGFFIAQKKGFYEAVGLEVAIVSPSSDDYQMTPAKKVEIGQADFALCPIESIISYRKKEKPFPLIAIAALLQSDLSAIATRKDVGIKSPKDLDGKVYSSYKAKYEDGIVKEMIKNDGGKGDLEIIYPEKLGIWNTLLEGEADATWVFLNWEGVEAEESGVDLNYFKLNDYQIPYSYSPVIAANAKTVQERNEAYKAFIRATKKGFLYCNQQPEEAIQILRAELPEHDKSINLAKALALSSPNFGNTESWGVVDKDDLGKFLDWIKRKRLEVNEIQIAEIFTDACL